MWVEAVFSIEDLTALMARVVPLKIHIHPEADADHYIELTTATDMALVADQGLRMTTSARIHWPILGIAVPINIDPLRVMIRPAIVRTPGGDALYLSLEIENADVAGVPAFADQAIVDKINGEHAERNVDIAWAFSEMLSHRFDLPATLEPLESLALNVAWGKVRVTEEAMVLAVSFHAEIARRDDEIGRSGPAVVNGRAVARRDAPVARTLVPSSSHLHRGALLGGAALAAVGAYFIGRGAGRKGGRWFRRALH
jgi:hypothetical protein